MSLTPEAIIRSADWIVGQEKRRPLLSANYESDLKYSAKEMPKNIMQIFVNNKLEPMTRETIFQNLKRTTQWRLVQGHAVGFKWEDRNIQSQLETMFDETLRVLTENNYIQYNCYSTVCHYVYRGKK